MALLDFFVLALAALDFFICIMLADRKNVNRICSQMYKYLIAENSGVRVLNGI